MIVQPGNGYGFSSSGYGVSLDIGGPFPELNDPAIIYLNPSLSGDKVSVSPGTVNRYIPKIGSVYIDAASAPKITVSGPGYICVKCTYAANSFFPRTATIVFETGDTPPVDTNSQSFYPLAKVNEETTGGVTSLTFTRLVEPANLVVNRLKAGANNATWWWTRV